MAKIETLRPRVRSDHFPWLMHRSMADVAETEALLARQRRGPLPIHEQAQLDILLWKQGNHNPPAETP